MPYKNITEFGSKSLFFKYINIKCNCYNFNKKNNFDELYSYDNKYVVKIDCGIKGRFKKGLMKINVDKNEIIEFIITSIYNNFIIEPFINYTNKEYYLSIINNGSNITINYSIEGGIDLGKNTIINNRMSSFN